MTASTEQYDLINELKKQLETANELLKKEKDKLKERSKKAYRKRFLIDKENLTDDEKQIQKQKIEKRRAYMNKRYNEIYKKRNEEKKKSKL